MAQLNKFAARENTDPNTQIVKVVDPETGLSRLVHQQVSNNFETASVQSGVSYRLSAIGEMRDGELDQLKAKKEKKMEVIEENYR